MADQFDLVVVGLEVHPRQECAASPHDVVFSDRAAEQVTTQFGTSGKSAAQRLRKVERGSIGRLREGRRFRLWIAGLAPSP